VNGTAGYKSELPVAAGEIVLVDEGGDDGGDDGGAASGVFTPGSDATGPVTLPASFTSREAAFDNELGFFLTDADGSINGIAPGGDGWAEAGLRSPTRQVLFQSGSDAGAQATPSFTAGDNIVFYLIQDNTTDVFLEQNASNEVGGGPLAFFSIAAANPDGEDHVQFSQTSDGLMEFRWEDLTGLGDEDFNDLVFTIDVDEVTDEPGAPTDPTPPPAPPPTDPPPTDPPPTDPPPTDPPPTDPPPTDPPPTDPPPVPPPGGPGGPGAPAPPPIP
jgi:hypothetical protein